MARGQEVGPDPPRKSWCRALFSLPPLLDVTARCSSSAACPARGTAALLRGGRVADGRPREGVTLWSGALLRGGLSRSGASMSMCAWSSAGVAGLGGAGWSRA